MEKAVGLDEGQVVEDVITGGDGAVVVIDALSEERGGSPCDLHEEDVQGQGLG